MHINNIDCCVFFILYNSCSEGFDSSFLCYEWKNALNCRKRTSLINIQKRKGSNEAINTDKKNHLSLPDKEREKTIKLDKMSMGVEAELCNVWELVK